MLRRLFGVELEEVGDDFGFGRVGREAVGGNALAARCTSGAGGSPHHSAPTPTRSTPKYYGAERPILAKGMFIAADRSQCGSMIYTFYMFCTDKSEI